MTPALALALVLAQVQAPLPAVVPAPVSLPPSQGLETPNPSVWLVPIGHTLGLLVGMRLSLTILWPEAYDPFPLERSADRFASSYTSPPDWRGDRSLLEADGDPWTINVIGHGLFGAEVYGRFRRCGGSPLAALAFVTGTSLTWEYGVESFSKRPSGVDLILTPVLGMAIGEARFQVQRALANQPRGFWRRLAEIVIDPLGEAERGWLGTRC